MNTEYQKFSMTDFVFPHFFIQKQDALLADMMVDDKQLGNKRKFFGLF